MRIPDNVRKCVAFVGYRDGEGRIRLAGTVFFMSRTVLDDRFQFTYAVTAKHVIDGIRDRGGTPLLRVNQVNGNAQWVELPLEGWKFHPDETEVDVAVMRVIHDDAVVDLTTFPIQGVATAEFAKEVGIGIGQDLFLTGLFAHHYGTERNIPIVRVGNIAAMPEEKIETPMGLIDAYLVEARSIGGLSGSPVFAHLGAVRVRDGKLQHTMNEEGNFYLLGLMHGHFDVRVAQDDVSVELDGISNERINSGIAIVVPVEKILDVINQPFHRTSEDDMIARYLREQKAAAAASRTEQASDDGQTSSGSTG